jgi:hypothetical protein
MKTFVTLAMLGTLFAALGVGLGACAAQDGAKAEGTGSAETSPLARFLELDVGEITFADKSVCSVIGTQMAAKEGGGFLAITAYHCFAKGFQCRGEPITWRKGGTSTCTGAITGKGRGAGDVALIRLDKGPTKVTRHDFPKGLGIGNALVLVGPKSDFAGCKVLDIVGDPYRIVHDCAKDVSSGLSGAPLFRIEGTEKKLIGIHVNHATDSLEATLWPVELLQDHFAGNVAGASLARAADAYTSECRAAFFDYLRANGVAAQTYDRGFMARANAHLEKNPKTFENFLASESVPFHLRAICRKRGAGVPAGSGLLKKDDACLKGYASETCWKDCCTGTTVKVDIADGNKPGCSLYFEDNQGPEAACIARPGKPANIP